MSEEKLKTFYFEFFDEEAKVTREGYIKALNEEVCKTRLSKITGVNEQEFNVQYMWNH